MTETEHWSINATSIPSSPESEPTRGFRTPSGAPRTNSCLYSFLVLGLTAAISTIVILQNWEGSVHAVRNLQPPPREAAFLLWSSPRPDGFNNQLISLYEAITCADHLNRTLVLPYMYENVRYDSKRQGPFPFEDYFNVSQLASVINVTTPLQLQSRRFRTCKRIVYKEAKVPLVLKFYGESLHVPLTNADQVTDPMSDSCIDDSLCNGGWNKALGAYSIYEAQGQGYDMNGSDYFRRIRRALQPHKDIIRLADEWQNQISKSFNAMHIRRGDYAQKCKQMKNECKKFGANAFFQSQQRLLHALIEFTQRDLPIFVSTTHDEESQAMLQENTTSLWFSKDFDVPADLQWMRKRTDLLALTSQVLASRAEEFIANRFSSFSSEVNRMRQLRNASVSLMFF